MWTSRPHVYIVKEAAVASGNWQLAVRQSKWTPVASIPTCSRHITWQSRWEDATLRQCGLQRTTSDHRRQIYSIAELKTCMWHKSWVTMGAVGVAIIATKKARARAACNRIVMDGRSGWHHLEDADVNSLFNLHSMALAHTSFEVLPNLRLP